MPKPNEHKTVQARILEYAEAIGWTFVSQKESEQRRGFDPETPIKDRAKGRTLFLQWRQKLDVTAKSIFIRPMNRKWASCSTKGMLSFNDELLLIDRKLGEYVIIHELLHLRVPNHGKLWKSLMRAHLGDYEIYEKALRGIYHSRLK